MCSVAVCMLHVINILELEYGCCVTLTHNINITGIGCVTDCRLCVRGFTIFAQILQVVVLLYDYESCLKIGTKHRQRFSLSFAELLQQA